MQPNTHQAPGTAWQNDCNKPSSFGTGVSLWANTTPLVPMVAETIPRRTTPVPTAAAQQRAVDEEAGHQKWRRRALSRDGRAVQASAESAGPSEAISWCHGLLV
jgi:hypothetical protein